MNQKGFATLEVIMMVVVIGILATIAVPRFTDVTTKANTAKIQADLTTIDTALQMYFMEQGKDASSIKDLVDKDYLMETPTPPTGKAYVDGTETDITAKSYGLTDIASYEAQLDTVSNTTVVSVISSRYHAEFLV